MTTTATNPTEQLLIAHKVDYERDPSLELGLIDLAASITNQARFEAIDQVTVTRYVEAIADGAVFPPIIVRRIRRPNGTTKHVVLSGNHRLRAHIDAHTSTIDAYLVDVDDLQALELAYADNATHGLATSEEERIAHALTLHEKGRSIADACKTVGISRSRVDARLKSTEQEARAARVGVPAEFARLANATRSTLASVKEDKVFIALVRAINKYGIASGPGGANRLIGDANSQPDISSALAIINLSASTYQQDRVGYRTVGRPSENPYIKLRMALGTIKGLNAADVVDRCTSPEDTHELLLAGARHLMAIDKLLELERQQDAPTGLKAVR